MGVEVLKILRLFFVYFCNLSFKFNDKYKYISLKIMIYFR